jgi:hypothetical protein
VQRDAGCAECIGRRRRRGVLGEYANGGIGD